MVSPMTKNSGLLQKMCSKSLIVRLDVKIFVYSMHPFVRAYCQNLDGSNLYRSKFIQVTTTNLIEIARKSNQKDAFSDARKEFIADSVHFENALKIVCDDCRVIDGESREDLAARRDKLLSDLKATDLFENLFEVVFFLSFAFSSSQFDLLFNFLDTLLDLIPKEAKAPDLCATIKSFKIRSRDFFTEELCEQWIEEVKEDVADASTFVQAQVHYSHGLYTALTYNNNHATNQRLATEQFQEAANLTEAELQKHPLHTTLRILLHCSKKNLAIQKTKSKNVDLIKGGRNELVDLLPFVKKTWGVHPISMEAEKSLADIYLKEGTLKGAVNRSVCEKALKHYCSANNMMTDMDITQEQSRVRLLKNKAYCMLLTNDNGVQRWNEVEELYCVMRRLICQCKPCPLKYEIWIASAVFYECLTISKRLNPDSTTDGTVDSSSLGPDGPAVAASGRTAAGPINGAAIGSASGATDNAAKARQYALEVKRAAEKQNVKISLKNVNAIIDGGKHSNTALKLFSPRELARLPNYDVPLDVPEMPNSFSLSLENVDAS